jgi:hypothetical protein
MKQLETRIRRLRHALQAEASSRDDKVDAVAQLQLLLAAGPEASCLEPIEDDWWIRWAKAFLSWATAGWSAAEPSARESAEPAPFLG